ncbi:hypothetical protein [Clostridium sp.]|uniref:hypothetical protein n=1 Tax=Clostridium sp. TaxID=1506 RepID=UPI003D6CDC4A
MENVQKTKVGAGILTISIIQLVFSGFALLGFVMMFFMSDATKSQLKALGTPEAPTATIIISIVLILIVALGITLILMKKELGIYIYFIGEVANIVYSLVTTGFKPIILFSFIIPVLMGIFILKKKEVFFVDAKAKI